MQTQFDCIVCGSCTVDILVKPVELDQPIGGDRLFSVEPIEATTGGIVSNAGMVLAKFGQRTAALTYVGDDEWGEIVRRRYALAGIDASLLVKRQDRPTSTTVVLIDSRGQRSFAHCQGAPKLLDKAFFLDRLDHFARSRMVLMGYYSLMPRLEPDLAEVLAAIRETGCQTALDCAGSGGTMDPLSSLLPHLDYYVPSYSEARNQTGLEDPVAILRSYRECGAQGVVGVKLGSQGALLSGPQTDLIRISPVAPPGPVVDTTGAGDCFYAGLLTGMLLGQSLEQAGRLAAAAGACCVTALGASAGIRSLSETLALL